MKRTVILITVIIISSKLLGFIREMILAYYYGTTAIVDAYKMSEYIPKVLFCFITAIPTVIVPIYIDIKKKKGDYQAKKTFNTIITYVILFSAIIIPTFMIFHDNFIDIMAPGFDTQRKSLTSEFVVINVWYILFATLAEMFVGYLYTYEKFLSARWPNILISFVQIIGIIFSTYMGLIFMAWGFIASYIAYFLCILNGVFRFGYKYEFSIDYSQDIKSVSIMLIPVMISTMLDFFNIYIDRFFATGLSEGRIAALSYASTLNESIYVVGSTAIMTIIYPKISTFISDNDFVRAKDTMANSIRQITLIFMPIIVVLFAKGQEITRILFQHGEFNSESTMLTSIALAMYGIGMLPRGIREIYSKALYALKDTMRITVFTLIAAILNIILDALFIEEFGHAGLAFASSVSGVVLMPMYYFALKNKIGTLFREGDVLFFLKVIASAIGMLALLLMLGILINVDYESTILSLIILLFELIIAIVVYARFLLFFKVEDVKDIISLCLKRVSFRG